MFLACVDRENGNLLNLPCEGGILGQPWKTMQVFEFLQSIFIERVRKHLERLKADHGPRR